MYQLTSDIAGEGVVYLAAANGYLGEAREGRTQPAEGGWV